MIFLCRKKIKNTVHAYNINNIPKSKNNAFTLAELLTSVLIISVIMIILAPVITKRMKDNLAISLDNKKGLETYTNPGLYTFDVPAEINTLYIQGAGGGGGGGGANEGNSIVESYDYNATLTVPTGINKITIKITGAGGGGGAGNGATTGATSCENNPGDNGMKPNATELAKYPLYKAIRISDDGSDLCIFKRNVADDGIWSYSNRTTTFLPTGSMCTSEYCCWIATDDKKTGNTGNKNYPYSYKGDKRTVCTYQAAGNLCETYGRTVEAGPDYAYRLPTSAELEKIKKYLDDFSRGAGENGLQLCSSNYLKSEPDTVPQCGGLANCIGSASYDRCSAEKVWGMGSIRLSWSSPDEIYGGNASVTDSGSVRCVKSLKYYNGYWGSGGASGAGLEKEINVLPGDTLQISIGAGGEGGIYNTSKSNGMISRTGNGTQGGTTQVVHKRGSNTLGTYYVKGGFGGFGATASSNGEILENGTASDKTTPSGTCYANGTTACKIISYSGSGPIKSGGTDVSAGFGGIFNNTGTVEPMGPSSAGGFYTDSKRTATQRATAKEIAFAKGQNASINGYGGGGGYTPNWATGTEHFYQGGNGAKGKVEIAYNIALPGGGGGSAARVGGNTDMNEMYEIKYNVANLDKIVFKVGSGGTGGVASQDGLNGSATVIGDNDIVFLAGEGGKTATNDDKNNVRGGRGGNTSYINEDDEYENVASGIKIKNPSTTSLTYLPNDGSFKGENGKRGGKPSNDDIQSGYTLDNTIFYYGFAGGMGASPFGIADAKIGASISCGGGNITGTSGIAMTLGLSTNLNYLCASGNIKGNSALMHDPVNNEFGGGGGGGGGVADNSLELGSGGNGSSGYVRIRWDMAEND